MSEGKVRIGKEDNMLQIRNLTITHRKDYKIILEDFSFVLNAGDKAVVIGEEGNGKSSLLKWIFQPELIESYADANGERIINNERLGYLPQELSEKDSRKTIYEFFTENAVFWEKTPKELGKLAKTFGVQQDFYYKTQTMGTLSGGEKVKAQLMRLLIEEPTMLLLDEPSNDLDIETLEWLEKFISESECGVLFISHDETLIEQTANVVIHIEQLRRKTKSRYTVMRMPYKQYITQRRANFDRQEQVAFNQRREQKLKEEKIRKIQQKVENVQNSISRQDPHGARMLKKKMHAVKAMEHRYERESAELLKEPEEETAIFVKFGENIPAIPSGKTVLEYSLGELYSADGKSILAKDIFLQIRGSEKICIVGKNGAGKTTLLKKIVSDLAGRTDIRAEYMPQDYTDLLEAGQTPVEFLCETGDKAEETKIRTYLGSMKYTADEMNHPLAELSGGQKAKLFMLKMSVSGANVLIMDEPTRNFSPLSGPVIRKMLKSYPGAIISISHDRKYIGEVCDRVLTLSENGLEAQD